MNRGVYILQGKRRYIGSTNNLERRLAEHKKGSTHTTKRIGEWKLIKWIPCELGKEAKTLEKKIKKGGHYDRLVM